jgi:hypothetical protein
MLAAFAGDIVRRPKILVRASDIPAYTTSKIYSARYYVINSTNDEIFS